MEKMTNKIEIGSLVVAAIASSFTSDLVQKIIITSVAMVIGTTVAFYWKKHLEKKYKK